MEMQWEWIFWPFAIFLGALSIAGLVLWIWALVDCVKVPDDSMYESGNKLIWVLILVFLNWIGAVLYLLIGRPKAGSIPGVPPPASPPGRATEAGTPGAAGAAGTLPPPPGGIG